jgi:hypothetical protein
MLCLGPRDCLAQNAELSGVVRDSQNAVIAEAGLRLVNQDTGVVQVGRSNDRGAYVFAAVQPGRYRLEVLASGFAPALRADIVLNVDQRAIIDFDLSVAGHSEAVTVSRDRSLLGSADGSVGTVIDRKFAASLPILGRSFSSLVALAPGVSPLASTQDNGSEFSVNGQRGISNYLTIDGLSAQVEIGNPMAADTPTVSGERFASTITGGLNGLVSMDALQEIRIQTSSFAAEFGRTPGAQVSLVTRSGTNALHGSAFEQFRNDALMANNWFTKRAGIEKPPLDEHQFGAAVGGPLVRDRSFFFFSYEGLRLLQPEVITGVVPSLELRQQNTPLKDVWALFPEPTGPSQPDLTAEHLANHPRHTSADTFGLRLDHTITTGLQVFARYSHAPSTAVSDYPLTVSKSTRKVARSINGGLTATLGQNMLVDVRAAFGSPTMSVVPREMPALRNAFGGAGDPDIMFLIIGNLDTLADGVITANGDRQGNASAFLSSSVKNHHLKFGSDIRWSLPHIDGYNQTYISFDTVAQAQAFRDVGFLYVSTTDPLNARYMNWSLYAQDSWKAGSRASVTYGVRWDINPAPTFAEGEGPVEVLRVDPIDQLEVTQRRNAPQWRTNYANIFPRLGISYALDREARTTLSGGVGLFGDLEGPAAGGLYLTRSSFGVGLPLPFTASDFVTPDPSTAVRPVRVTDPNLETPTTAQWNVMLEREMGRDQAVSVAYVGAKGYNLLQTNSYTNPTATSAQQVLVTSGAGRSAYRSMQLQYRKRASVGLQVIGSYTLSDAKDTTSNFNNFSLNRKGAEELAPGDADLRHSASLALSWNLPSPQQNGLIGALSRDWALHAVGTARSGYPFTVFTNRFEVPGVEAFDRRASLVPGVPVIVEDSTAPGGQRYNLDAFTNPPDGEQGNTGRNAFRGFSAYQIDMALQRAIRLGRVGSFELRIEAFNVTNQSIFGLPYSYLPFSSLFGKPRSLIYGSSIYRSGAPRSVGVSTRFVF